MTERLDSFRCIEDDSLPLDTSFNPQCLFAHKGRLCDRERIQPGGVGPDDQPNAGVLLHSGHCLVRFLESKQEL